MYCRGIYGWSQYCVLPESSRAFNKWLSLQFSTGLPYLDQMLGPLSESQLYRPLRACPLLKASRDSYGWLNRSVIPKNEQRKQATGLLGAVAELGLGYFLDAKGKTHGLPDSTKPGANKNRTMPLMSIMCDLSDLIFISSSPKLKALSGCQRWSLTYSVLLSTNKPWMDNTFRHRLCFCLNSLSCRVEINWEHSRSF